MSRKRLALAVAMAALGLGALGSFSNASAQTEVEGGVAFGGLRFFGEPIWIRLDPGRSSVRYLELPWHVNGKRCSDRTGYASVLLAGAEWDAPMWIAADGTFRKTVVDDYRDLGRRYTETQTVKGTIRATRVVGTIEGKVTINPRGGQVVRCTFGPQHWVAHD